MKYFLGILNSNLINFYYKNIFIDYNIKPTYIKQIPSRSIDFDKHEDKVMQDRLVKLVDTMLELHKQLHNARTETDKRHIQTRIEHTDRQIDQLVYELYDLTEEEIKIVEEK